MYDVPAAHDGQVPPPELEDEEDELLEELELDELVELDDELDEELLELEEELDPPQEPKLAQTDQSLLLFIEGSWFCVHQRASYFTPL